MKNNWEEILGKFKKPGDNFKEFVDTLFFKIDTEDEAEGLTWLEQNRPEYYKFFIDVVSEAWNMKDVTTLEKFTVWSYKWWKFDYAKLKKHLDEDPDGVMGCNEFVQGYIIWLSDNHPDKFVRDFIEFKLRHDSGFTEEEVNEILNSEMVREIERSV